MHHRERPDESGRQASGLSAVSASLRWVLVLFDGLLHELGDGVEAGAHGGIGRALDDDIE